MAVYRYPCDILKMQGLCIFRYKVPVLSSKLYMLIIYEQDVRGKWVKVPVKASKEIT